MCFDFTFLQSIAVSSEIDNLVRAIDDDVSTLQYEIIEQNPAGYFTLPSPNTNGFLRIRLDEKLDYQNNTQHTLRM